jgi:hypothetical protein
MQKKEWPCVANLLGLLRFPYDLQFETEDVATAKDSAGVKRVVRLESKNGANVQQNRPQSAETHLHTKETDAMLHYAINPNTEQYPICPDEQVTHMAGVAVARLAGLAMLRKVENFKELLDKAADDLAEEMCFSPNKLHEHILCLTEPKVCVSLILDEASISSKITGQNNPLLVFRTIPDHTNANGENIKGGRSIMADIKDVQTCVDAVLNSLNTKNREINSQIRKKPPAEQVKLRESRQKFRHEIKYLLHEETPKKLGRIIRDLDNIVSDINILKASLRDDWTADVVVLWQNGCEPHEKRECIG